ncbi:MAG: UDP-N-acetylmuramoyl-tripeptide--D-alanyl-D-alanine ligase [Geminicoccaceae bacterium]|nr:MAG: UDP-N-acetylmuramoyl-tripeptide--D-alanyl-D-alanine ligase [Geminicoccaceae bacterium]
MSGLWQADEAARATGGTAEGGWSATGVSIDSRSVAPGDLFVALVHARDGHDFVADALAKGASAAMVSRVPDGVDPARLLLVGDTQAGLEALGHAGRARSAARIAGITGSVGKTGTKAALAHGLAQQGEVHASAKSFNNQWGVPTSLAQLPRSADYAVFEMGMNRAGEIARLTRQVRPHVALITAIAPAHLAYFGDEAGIARAKAEIFEGVEPGGTAVVVGDSIHTPLLRNAAAAAGVERIVTFATDAPADWQARRLAADAAGSEVEATGPSGTFRFRIGLPGAHWVKNALGILATAEALGADVDALAQSLATVTAEPGRGRRHVLAVPGGEVVLIDDAYNANPASMRAAIDVLAMAPGRKVAALGAMKELGAGTLGQHAALAEPLRQAGVELVFTAGEEMTALAGTLAEPMRGGHGSGALDLVDQLRAALRPGDTLLVKGSLASGMGALVKALLEGGQG